MQKTIGWGIAGLAAGVLYSTTYSWIATKAKNGDLDPATDVLHTDPEMFALFMRLQEHRSLDDSAFRTAVDNVDRLMYLRSQLEDNPATLKDRPCAFGYFKTSIAALEKLLTAAKKHPSAKVPVEVHSLYVKLYSCIESVWKDLMRQTQKTQEKNFN